MASSGETWWAQLVRTSDPSLAADTAAADTPPASVAARTPGRKIAHKPPAPLVRIIHLAVRGLPGSGTPQELMEAAGISAGRVVQAAREILGA
jgi:hypothetical protein